MLFKFRVGKYRIGFYFKHFLWKTTFVNGITSQCFDGDWNHVLFWDFEPDLNLSFLQHTLRNLQRTFKLNTIHIFQSGTRKSYRAICNHKMNLKKMVTIIRLTPMLDIAFLKWTMIRRSATIRVTPKEDEQIRHVDILHSKTAGPTSLPHALVLNHLWKIPIPENNDGLEKIIWVNYETVLKKEKKEVEHLKNV